MSGSSKRPAIRLRLTAMQVLLEVVALAGLTMLLSLLAYASGAISLKEAWVNYLQLSEVEDLTQLQVLSGLALLLYVLLSVMGHFPQLFNYPAKVSPPNAAYHYQFMRSLLRWLKIECIYFLLFLAYLSILLQNGTLENFNPSNLLLFLLIILLTLGIYRYKMRNYLRQGHKAKQDDYRRHKRAAGRPGGKI